MKAMFENLTISSDKDEELTLDKGKEGGCQYDQCLVGRFLTDWVVNPIAMKNLLGDLWRPRKGVSRGGKIGLIRWASPVRPELGPG